MGRTMRYRCADCTAYKKLMGKYPTVKPNQCQACNRNAVFVGFWKRKLKAEGKEALIEQRARLVEQVGLLDYIIEKERG